MAHRGPVGYLARGSSEGEVLHRHLGSVVEVGVFVTVIMNGTNGSGIGLGPPTSLDNGR